MAREPAETDLLLALAQLAVERRSLEEVFSAFARRLVDGASVEYASLLTRDAETNTWRVAAIFPEERAAQVGRVPRVTEADVERLRAAPAGLLYRTEGRTPIFALFRSFGLRWGWSVLLTLEEEVLGLFTVARCADTPFDESEQAFFRAAARFLSHALREEVRLAISQRWANRSRLLNDVSLLLGGGAPVEALFVDLAGREREELPLDLLLLFRVIDGRLRASGVHPGSLRPWSHLNREERQWLERRVAALESPEVASVEAFPDGISRRLQGQGIRRVWVGRLADSDGTLGVLVVGWRSERRPTPTEDWFVRTLATLISQALGRERALAQERLEADQREVLARAAAVAASHRTSEEVVRALAGPIGRVVPRPVIGWAFVGEGGFRLARGPRAPLGWLATNELPGLPLSGDIVFSFDDLPPPLANAEVRSPSVAVVAAASGGELVGHLLVGSRTASFRFDDRSVGLVSLVASVVAPSLRNARLAEDADRLRRAMEVILQSLSEAILLLDKDVRLVWANERGKAIADAIDPERRLRGVAAHLPRLTEEVGRALVRALEGRERAVGRTRWTVEGRTRWFDFEMVPLDHPEFSVVCVVSDVTAQVEAAEQERRHREEMERASRLATIGEIVSGVAHELNNPLTSVLGFAELASRSAAAGAVREELELIRREALRARNIVRDLLFIARPGTPERKPFTLEDVVGHVVRLREREWRQHGLRSEVDVAVRRPVLGSEAQVTQVLLNLVTNAEQALEGRTEPCLWVRVWEEGDVAVVEVGDNGPGVPPEARARIFEPFFTTKKGRGTGLGLSLSRSIVESHGGRIWLEEGDGATRFRFSLPLASERLPEGRPEEPPRTGGDRRRVLVVDDEEGIRRMAVRLLAGLGHEVCAVASAAEAEAAVRTWRPDAVLCDYRLRGETAGAVLARFQLAAPELIGRTLLVTGATSDRGVVELAEQYGLPVIAKPFSAEELAVAIAGLP